MGELIRQLEGQRERLERLGQVPQILTLTSIPTCGVLITCMFDSINDSNNPVGNQLVRSLAPGRSRLDLDPKAEFIVRQL